MNFKDKHNFIVRYGILEFSKLSKIFLVIFMLLLLSLQATGASALNILDGQAVSSIDNSKLREETIFDFSIKDYSKASLMKELIVLPEERYNIDEANKMIGRLGKIPTPILDGLLKEDIKIILSNTNITGIKEYEYLEGVTPRGWEGTGRTWDDVPGAGGKPVVARIGYSDPGESHGSINLELHETAHAIDEYVFKNISSSDEYKVMWKKEVVNLFGNDHYFLDYPEEYFAETFAMFYLSEAENSKLKGKAPLTYEFIKNLEIRLNGVTGNLTSYSTFL